MQSDPPGPASEEFSVRLRWPSAPDAAPEPAAEPADEPDDGELAAPAVRPGTPTIDAAPAVEPSARVSPASSASSTRPTTLRTEPATVDAGRRRAAGEPVAPRPASPATSSSADPSAPLGAAMAGVGGSSTARPFVDAFDRLSERLLDRLRALRQDLDGDLAALRGEVAALRQAVDEAGQGNQVRQLQLSLDEARVEVAALRRAVLEWPELERVSDEVASMRGDLLFLVEGGGVVGGRPSALVGELQELLVQLSEQVDAATQAVAPVAVGARGADAEQLGWLVDEVASIRSELVEVTKRVRQPARIHSEQLTRLVEAVAARVVDELEARNKRPKRR